MKLKAEALHAHLKKTQLPVYFITGDETLLVDETADALRKAARDAGFDNREVLFAERGFDWGHLARAGASLSLFSSRQLLELRLPTGKPGREGGRALVDYMASAPDDTLLIIIAPKLDRRSRDAAWVKAIDKVGAVITIWSIDYDRLPQWIAERARNVGLELSIDAANVLAERVEGNLLAAAQEIDKLTLLVDPGPVGVSQVQEAVAASARYDVFGLADAALGGDGARALTMLAGLKAEGVAPALVLWALTRDIRIMAHVSFDVAGGRPARKALADKRLWKKKHSLVESALRRLGRRSSERLLLHAGATDRIIKGPRHGEAWLMLRHLTAMLAGVEPVVSVDMDQV